MTSNFTVLDVGPAVLLATFSQPWGTTENVSNTNAETLSQHQPRKARVGFKGPSACQNLLLISRYGDHLSSY